MNREPFREINLFPLSKPKDRRFRDSRCCARDLQANTGQYCDACSNLNGNRAQVSDMFYGSG